MSLSACLQWLASTSMIVSAMGEIVTLNERPLETAAGWTVTSVAAPPLIERPIEADIDELCRLYVTESSGSNEPVKVQLEKKPHRVLRLSDTNADGIYDEKTVFADQLMFPEGILCLGPGEVLVAACPEIWRLTDHDGDGVAEKRTVWFDGKTLSGCANDLHGPYLGPDGWIYWCKGGFSEHEATFPTGKKVTTRASHIYRAKNGPDGAEQVEIWCSGGMDNPVGLTWSPEGELFCAGTFFVHPGGGQRDGILHAVRGGVWGKEQEFLKALPRTGDLMPIMTHLGPAAPAGMTRLGRELLCCQFNMHKVSRHQLMPAGSSYTTQNSDLLSSTHPDFHPTDVLQDRDGSVLVIDTGGWYKICCPTSQLAKPEVPGAIYRLTKTGGNVPRQAPSPQWSVGKNAEEWLQSLSSLQPAQQRQALEGLSREKEGNVSQALTTAVKSLLLKGGNDRFLDHACLHALMENGEREQIKLWLTTQDAPLQRAALVVLNEIEPKAISAEQLPQYLTSGDEAVRQAALQVASQQTESRKAVIEWLGQHLFDQTVPRPTLLNLVKVFGHDASIQQRLKDKLFADLSPQATNVVGFDLIKLVAPDKLPSQWSAVLCKCLDAPDAVRDLFRAEALQLIRKHPLESPSPELLTRINRIIIEETVPLVQIEALAALPGKDLSDQAFAAVLPHLSAAEPWRSRAVNGFAQRALTGSQLEQIAPLLEKQSTLARLELLKAWSHCADSKAGQALLQALRQQDLAKSLPRQAIVEAFSKQPADVRQAVNSLPIAVGVSDPEKMAKLKAFLPSGDIKRGAVVFASAKTACTTCHQTGYKGGDLGPDLSRIGAIRTPDDLLEAIVFPSASFVRSYEPMLCKTKGEQSHYGIIRDRSDTHLTLAAGANVPPTRIPLDDIVSLVPGEFSLMPPGLSEVLTSQEMADLVAFLAALK